jgi:hypothetical protein
MQLLAISPSFAKNYSKLKKARRDERLSSAGENLVLTPLWAAGAHEVEAQTGVVSQGGS